MNISLNRKHIALVIVASLAAVAALAAPASALNKNPKPTILNLTCSVGELTSSVTNPTKTNVPTTAAISVRGVEKPCDLSFTGALAAGATKQLQGCVQAAKTCRASAKWTQAD